MSRDRARTATLVPLSMFLAMLLLGTGGMAQAAPGSLRPYKLPPSLLEYFKTRYGQVDNPLVATLQETPDGPLGNLHLSGRMRPAVSEGGDTPKDRARSIARAFLDQEALLFDITDPAEIGKPAIEMKDDGTAIVDFSRTIGGLPLMDWSIRIQVAADETIARVTANLTPASTALYDAVKRRTISNDEVRRIVARDLGRPGRGAPKIYQPGLLATWRPPYLVWSAGGSVGAAPWAYSIDAFTGKILTRSCSAVPARFAHGVSLCDPPEVQATR
jgi:hypothetical protein